MAVTLKSRWTMPILFMAFAAIAIAVLVGVEPDLAATKKDRAARAELLIGIAGFFVLAAAAATRPRFWLDERGVRGRRLLRTTAIGWDEVERYTLMTQSGQNMQARGAAANVMRAVGRAGVARDPHRTIAYARMCLFAGDGRKVAFNPGLFLKSKPFVQAVDFASERLHPRLRARGAVSFAPFALDDKGLSHPKIGQLSYDFLDRVEIHDRLQGFRVFHKGVDAPWLAVPLGQFANPWLFVEALRARGLRVAIDPGVFVPRDISPG